MSRIRSFVSKSLHVRLIALTIATALSGHLAGIASAQTTLPDIPYPIPNASAGVPYSFNFGEGLEQLQSIYSQYGFSFTYSFSTDQALPPGLTLQKNGLLSGTPTQQGSFHFATGFALSLSFNDASQPPVSFTYPLDVTLNVGDNPSKGASAVDPSIVRFTFAQSGSSATMQTLTINNPSGQTKSFTVSPLVPSSYLSVSPSSNQIGPYSTASVSITVDPSRLSPGTFVETLAVKVSPTGESFSVPVVTTINSTGPVLTLSQTGLYFQAVETGAAPPPQTIRVLSNGSASTSFSTAVSTLSGGSWLSVSPANGSASQQESATLSVHTDPTGLKDGTYYGHVTVSTQPAGSANQDVSVVLNVAAAAQSPGPSLSTTGLIFVASQGGSSPAAQTATIANPSPNPVTVSSSAFSTTPKPLFTLSASSTTINTGSPVTLTVQPATAGLSAGVYPGEADLQFSDGSARRIAILVIVVPGTSTAANGRFITMDAGSCNPTKLVGVFTQLGAGFKVSAGWPEPIEMLIADDCGKALSNGSVVTTFSSGDPALSLSSLQDGRWAATWTPHGAAAQVTLTGTATEVAPALQGSASIGGGLQPNPTVPTISAGGIVSAASVNLQPSASPGGYISIYGSSLSAGQFLSDKLPFSTNLGGTQVYLAGQKLPLQIAYNGQINALIPYQNIPVNTQAQLFVLQNSAMSTTQTVTIGEASPGIFILSTGVGAIVDYTKNNVVVDASHPASPGDTLVIYCSGLGAVTNPPEAGAAALASPLSYTTNPVTVKIGGQDAHVIFAGLSPGYVGLYQINVTIPSSVSPDPNSAVVVKVAGQQSTPVMLNIQ